MTAPRPERIHRYTNLFMDSARWDRFVPRAGDIIVCTPYKSGTTWTQMICALLVFKTPELPQPLAELSPWLDMRMEPVEQVLTAYEAQTHRRIVKTHTALDGIPYFDEVTYLYCARDPREIFVSMWNHAKNQRIPRLVELLRRQGLDVQPPPPLPDDINERFRLWLTQSAYPWESDGFPYWSVFSHARTFLDYRELPNLHFLHYADLKADLGGQMRRIARILEIEIDEARWPQLIAAATFESMKRNADRVAPDTHLGAWESNAEFFKKGELGQWRELLSAESLALYERVKADYADPEFTDWLERGFIATGQPCS